ncbi:unnamed protein product [Closterium sp. NIES-53]
MAANGASGRGKSGGVGPCTYVLRIGGRRGETCGLPHTAERCLGRLTDAWRAQFPDAVELPRWGDLLRQNVAILDLDFDAILAAMHAMSDSGEGDCYLCVPPNPGGEAAAKGASASAAQGTGESAAPGTSESASLGTGESALSGIAPTEALHTLTLDSGASRSFFRDSTTLTLLSRPDVVSLADPSGGPILAHSSTVLPGQRVTHCTCSRTGCHLATFTRRPGSSLYTLTIASPPVTASSQVVASGQVPPSPSSGACPYLCSLCRGLATRRSSLLRVPSDRGSPADSPHGRTEVVSFPLTFSRLSAVQRASARRSRFRPPHSKMGLLSAALAWSWTSLPRVSFLETTPTLRWTGKVGDASVFRVWGSRAFVRDTSADKLSSRAVPCIAGVFYPSSAYLVPACSLQVLVRLRRESLG